MIEPPSEWPDVVAGEGDLESWIGRPRSEWDADDLVGLFQERRIHGLSLMHVGGDGWLKRLDFMPDDFLRFGDVLASGERADGSSLFRGTGIDAGSSDILLRPRIRTAFLDPFSRLATLCVLCGHVLPDGTPVPQSPDTILRRATHLLEEKVGVGLRAFGEVEFFLGRPPQDADLRAGADEGYHAAAPVVFGEEVRRLAQASLVRMGVPVKYAHAEVGWIGPEEGAGLVWEQHEIELAPAPLPDAADAVVLAQWVLRNVARSAGLRCVTDPIVVRGHAGNGLHVHFLPVRDGEPVPVREPDGRLSGPARWLVGGLVRTGGGLMAFGNRSPDSFTRLSQAREAPAGITWGEHDRSALVRLPVGVRGDDGAERSPRTVEFRLPDGSAFPHLLLAGVAMAMLRARDDAELEALLDSTASGDGEKGRAPRALPGRPAEVGAALAEARDVLEREGVFPSAFVGRLIERLGAGGDGSA